MTSITTSLDYSDQNSIDLICEGLLAEAVDASLAANCLGRIGQLVDQHPEAHNPRLTQYLLMEQCSIKHGMYENWLELHQQFPECKESQLHIVLWLRRLTKFDEAANFVLAHVPPTLQTAEDAIHMAQLYYTNQETVKSIEVLTTAAEKHRSNEDVIVALCSTLLSSGKIEKAWRYFQPLLTMKDIQLPAQELQAVLEPAVAALDRVAPNSWQQHNDTKEFAFIAAIEMFQNRDIPSQTANRIGPTVIVSNSLALGGAERQAVNTAVNLNAIKLGAGTQDNVKLEGPFHFVVSSVDSFDKKDILLPLAKAGGITIDITQDMDIQAVSDICPETPDLAALLPILPLQPLFNLQRLVDYFRQRNTEIAFLWQDGMVLYAVLAALIAGVPRIILNTRNIPPYLRPHLHRDVFEPMYRALSKVPGIRFVSNGKVAADAYCDWLDMPSDRFTVVPNGVTVAAPRNTAEDRQKWAEFEEATKDATHTVGGVFRFSVDKRPQLWVTFARDYLALHPDTRFVLVGGARLVPGSGSLLIETQKLAEDYGIAHRILFVGASDDVPFWLQKMDAFVLLSRHEGLPNVLIEAQMSGVPVVATPAGSTADTFLDGRTGYLLAEAEDPKISEICTKVENALALVHLDSELGNKARKFANETFSVNIMTKNTVNLLNQA